MSSQEVSREQKGGPTRSPLASLEFSRRNFDDPALEWRRLFSEILGTFLLVLVAAGGGTINAVSNGAISRAAAVTAPGLMVLAIILFMGAISGAHLNPAVSIAFATRGDFPWRRVPGYIIAQLVGATLACLLLKAIIRQRGHARRHRARSGHHRLDGVDYGVCTDCRPGEHDPGDSLQSAEPRAYLGVRGRCVHHPRRTVGKPDQWSIDESGALLWPGPGALELLQLLGVHCGSDRGWVACRRHRLHPAGSWW